MDSNLPYEKIFFTIVTVIPIAITMLQVQSRDSMLRIIRPVYWASAAFIFFYLSFLTYLQYNAFLEGLTLGAEGLFWFLGYVRVHFWNQYLISFIVSLLIFWISAYFNKRRGEIFFEKEETYIIALAVLLVGYPGFFFYIPLVLFASIILSLILVKKGERLPLYYFWMPICVAVLLIVNFWIMHQAWWATFRF